MLHAGYPHARIITQTVDLSAHRSQIEPEGEKILLNANPQSASSNPVLPLVIPHFSPGETTCRSHQGKRGKGANNNSGRIPDAGVECEDAVQVTAARVSNSPINK